ncbi:MAG: LysR family transcriptional regulator [Deltaproteobacteria bacterium]|nr:MAG: LysR family transcriptional regulator [Deltaproteobacteria bacterium]
MNLDVLRTFLKVAEEGHLTRAAYALHLTQPAVSAQLRKLEDEIGQMLFDRNAKGMVLNEAGEVFRSYAREIIDSFEEAKLATLELQELQRGSFSLGGGATAVAYLLPPLLGDFFRAHPGINVYIREQGSLATMEAVSSGELDLGVVTIPPEGKLPKRFRSQLTLEHWVDDELQLIVPNKHKLSGADEFQWSDLEEQALVLFEAGSAVRDLIDEGFRQARVEPTIVMELRSIESIKQMVGQGIGAGFVSGFALADSQGGLSCRSHSLRRQLGIVYRSNKRMSRAASAFLARMKDSQ